MNTGRNLLLLLWVYASSWIWERERQTDRARKRKEHMKEWEFHFIELICFDRGVKSRTITLTTQCNQIYELTCKLMSSGRLRGGCARRRMMMWRTGTRMKLTSGRWGTFTLTQFNWYRRHYNKYMYQILKMHGNLFFRVCITRWYFWIIFLLLLSQ